MNGTNGSNGTNGVNGVNGIYGNQDPQPTVVSPYMSRPVTVYIGPSRSVYTILESAINKHESLRSKLDASANPILELPEVDHEVGHTLIHWLYTGRYEILGSGTETLRAGQHKGSVLTYYGARACSLAELEKTAKSKIEFNAKFLTLPELLQSATELQPRLPKDEWFVEHIKSHVKILLKQKDTLEALIGPEGKLDEVIGKSAFFDRALFKSIAEMYLEKGTIPGRLERTNSQISLSSPRVDDGDQFQSGINTPVQQNGTPRLNGEDRFGESTRSPQADWIWSSKDKKKSEIHDFSSPKEAPMEVEEEAEAAAIAAIQAKPVAAAKETTVTVTTTSKDTTVHVVTPNEPVTATAVEATNGEAEAEDEHSKLESQANSNADAMSVWGEKEDVEQTSFPDDVDCSLDATSVIPPGEVQVGRLNGPSKKTKKKKAAAAKKKAEEDAAKKPMDASVEVKEVTVV
ncbi:hypothetical protein BT63DRAFT_408679 [Microthyrium microscopicum]|uniref:BTB domain-containing protein n=1 Tax=Microthyrium microscopicum TaxID=703497 RepID=A0A6A6UQE0_9PEZI|nr:hypothetical protein BT63DRAFT_408679 [Microthyrium microscopicum]